MKISLLLSKVFFTLIPSIRSFVTVNDVNFNHFWWTLLINLVIQIQSNGDSIDFNIDKSLLSLSMITESFFLVWLRFLSLGVQNTRSNIFGCFQIQDWEVANWEIWHHSFLHKFRNLMSFRNFMERQESFSTLLKVPRAVLPYLLLMHVVMSLPLD